MRASTAYFAGAGTVIVALVAGLGGGFLMADIMDPAGLRQVGKPEQRHAQPQQAQQSPQPPQPEASQTPAPYLAATGQAATTPVVVSPAPSSSPQPRNEPSAKNASPPNNAPPSPPPVAGHDRGPPPVAGHDRGSPEDASAKASDSDVKRAAEKRKSDRAERRRQWAAQRQQQQRGQQLRSGEAQAREDTEPGRNIIVRRDDSWRGSWREDSDRDDSDRTTRTEFPRFNLFGQD
jgi:hypothetical protein